MRDYEKWTGPYLSEELRRDSLGPFEEHLASEGLINELETLFKPLSIVENMSNSADYGCEWYEFYFRLPRGSFAENKKSFEDDPELGEEWFYKVWPRKWCWFSLGLSRDHYDGTTSYGLRIGGFRVLRVSDGKGENHHDTRRIIDKCRWIPPVKKLLKALLESMKKGEYEDFVTKNLDYRLRDGEIKYKDYWRIYPSEGRKHYTAYCGVDVPAFIRYFNAGSMTQSQATHFPTLTAKRYGEIFAIVTKALDLPYFPEMTPQENYRYNSDGRTQGLHLINGDSTEEFDAWYRENGRWPDHAFEIRYYKGAVRIDLLIRKDEDGYYLALNCGPQTEAGIKAFLSCAQEGIFLEVYDPKSYIKTYYGNNYLRIESQEGYFARKFPKTKLREFIKAIQWEPLELAHLKTNPN